MAEKTAPKIEQHIRNQVRAYLEVSKQSRDDLSYKIKVHGDGTVSALTISNFINGKSSIKTDNLELIIDQMRRDGYEFTI